MPKQIPKKKIVILSSREENDEHHPTSGDVSLKALIRLCVNEMDGELTWVKTSVRSVLEDSNGSLDGIRWVCPNNDSAFHIIVLTEVGQDSSNSRIARKLRSMQKISGVMAAAFTNATVTPLLALTQRGTGRCLSLLGEDQLIISYPSLPAVQEIHVVA